MTETFKLFEQFPLDGEGAEQLKAAEARVKELEEGISRLRSLVDPIALRLFDQHEAQQ